MLEIRKINVIIFGNSNNAIKFKLSSFELYVMEPVNDMKKIFGGGVLGTDLKYLSSFPVVSSRLAQQREWRNGMSTGNL